MKGVRASGGTGGFAAKEAAELLDLARQAAARAYCPYSGLAVGAAVLAEDGRVFTGCNVENASYGLTICAERVAVAAAVACGARRLVAVAVWSSAGRISPCGACRQVLAEFGADLAVALAGESGPEVVHLRDLLPKPFVLPG